ncbi:putative reverse transcriptase domain-containing protein [Tanacetum coccineum]
MVIELGGFDIIIGMDWLSRYDATILCGEKKHLCPLPYHLAPLQNEGVIQETTRVVGERFLFDQAHHHEELRAPILSLPEGSEDSVVYYDASLKGFGAVLMQREKVILYASRQLRKNEED